MSKSEEMNHRRNWRKARQSMMRISLFPIQQLKNELPSNLLNSSCKKSLTISLLRKGWEETL